MLSYTNTTKYKRENTFEFALILLLFYYYFNCEVEPARMSFLFRRFGVLTNTATESTERQTKFFSSSLPILSYFIYLRAVHLFFF